MRWYGVFLTVLAVAFAALIVFWVHYRPVDEARPAHTAAGDNKPIVFVVHSPTHAATVAPKSAPVVPSQTAAPAAKIAAPAPTPQAAGAPSAPLAASSVPSAMPMQVATVAPQDVKLPAVPKEPPNAPPQILSVSLSAPVARGGQIVSGKVETSSNVASVEARIGGYSAALQKIGVGQFTMSYQVPHLPFFLHKTYLVQVIARNTAGLSVSTAVPITIR